MNFFRSITILTLLLFGSYTQKAENQVISKDDNLLDVKIENFQVQDENIIQILSKIAYQYNVPIGTEISPKDDLLKQSSIEINVKNGTIRDVLDSVVSQNKLYTWEVKDNVINVYPVESYRDDFLKEILETQIESFSIKKNTSRLNFRESLTRNLILKEVMKKHGVTSEIEVFFSSDLSSLGRDFSLDFSHIKVKTLLNSVVRESKSKFWIVSRYGENRKLWLLNL